MVKPEEWDWSRTVVDHLDLHASSFRDSVRFYESVLAPLGIPKLYEHEREACFTHVNVVDRRPPTTSLHLCFYARTKSEVDGFHTAGVEAGFRSNGEPGYREYAPGYYAAYLLDPDGNNVEALYRDARNPGQAPDS
jgi:catechol 2,3-dioxygenase-like lactoylglutathione lyase family enzyme